MKEGKSRRGGIYWETVIDTEYSGDWGVDMMRRECVRKIRCVWHAYLWAAVFASTTPAVCIQERTEFSPPSGSSFIVVPPRGIVSWIPNIEDNLRVKEPPAKLREINVQACYPSGFSFSESRFRLARENPVHRSCLPLQSVRCEQFSKCCT